RARMLETTSYVQIGLAWIKATSKGGFRWLMGQLPSHCNRRTPCPSSLLEELTKTSRKIRGDEHMPVKCRAIIVSFFVVLSLVSADAQAVGLSNPRFKAVAFDYFVIFDPNSVVPAVERAFPGKGLEFTRSWRSKQFEYSFLRSITNDHEDF